MPRQYGKKTKYASLARAAKTSTDKGAQMITKTPTKAHLLKFALPTILSMLIMSTFGIVDGIFVSRIIDPTALAAVAIVFPFLSFVMANWLYAWGGRKCHDCQENWRGQGGGGAAEF